MASVAPPSGAYVDYKTTEQLMDLVKDKEIYVGLGVYGAEGESGLRGVSREGRSMLMTIENAEAVATSSINFIG